MGALLFGIMVILMIVACLLAAIGQCLDNILRELRARNAKDNIPDPNQ
jgi:hypothetical protein